ncbi:hypothetical protein [Streptomyces sp. 2A115]|uniref:hypothetical protein n=1 Tax=Streptomyces sp. 2A115 TaxID=3457439 RepID=UPI003FD0654A
MTLANVTGVGSGRDEDSGEDVIVVFVAHKVPRDRLRPEDVIPDELEGVPVRVLSIGEDEEEGEGEGEGEGEEDAGNKEEAGHEDEAGDESASESD